MDIKVETEINSPIKTVWEAITDFEHCADRISGIINTKVLERPQNGLVGLKWEETRQIFGKESTETMWITDTEEYSYYRTRAENCGAIYLSTMSVRQEGALTVLSMSFSGSANSLIMRLISSLMGIFIQGSMKKMMQKDLDDIKAFIESSAQITS
ncbi:SRPBCC family protein [Agaribacterium sp. ZY112]|uniref:SRPBCC family protein n=1 Tax=Agaribacterium sp. ZY112 TaxID=3233574 RepID=UPI003524D17A